MSTVAIVNLVEGHLAVCVDGGLLTGHIEVKLLLSK